VTRSRSAPVAAIVGDAVGIKGNGVGESVGVGVGVKSWQPLSHEALAKNVARQALPHIALQVGKSLTDC